MGAFIAQLAAEAMVIQRRLIRCVIALAAAVVVAGPTKQPALAEAGDLMQAGVAHLRDGKGADAVEALSRALALKALSKADTVRALFDRGVAYDAMGKTQAAIDDYSSAIRLDEAFSPALNNRANALRRLGRFSEAQRDYQAALRCPGVAREFPYYGLGQIAEKQGDAEAARDYYRKALSANSTYEPAARALAALGESPARAKPDAVKAPAASPAPKVKREPEQALRRTIVDANAPGVQVQLGAFLDQETARRSWNKIAAGSRGALDGHTPITIPVDIPGKGRLWRLRTAVPDQNSARALCKAIASHGYPCMVAPSDKAAARKR